MHFCHLDGFRSTRWTVAPRRSVSRIINHSGFWQLGKQHLEICKGLDAVRIGRADKAVLIVARVRAGT